MGGGRFSTDAAVGAKFAAGSDEARIGAFIQEHFDFIWRLLRRSGLTPEDADDGAQHVFMIAMEKIETIMPGRERSFLYGTALRVAANARRAVGRRREVSEDALEGRMASELGPERRSELGQAWALLDHLLEQLPDELRRVLVLAEIEQLEVPEIAALEAIPVGTAASRLRRARALFREQLRLEKHRNPFEETPP